MSAAPAYAACAPDPASSGQTVTCSGNDPDGFQAGGGANNLTVNVLPAATVSDGGGAVIIGVNDFNTVTNSGTLTAGQSSTGIFAGVNNTIVNTASGVIAVGDDGVGIFAAGNSTVTNAGQITIGDAAGLVAAIVAINDDNTVSNLAGATITVGLNADGILMQGDRAIVNNAGTINVTAFGAAIDVFGDDALITSNGVINVGDNAAGISTQGDRALITHFGTINGGIASAGVAYIGSSGTINNSGRILLGDDAFGIVVLGDSNTITNSGTITVGAGFAVGIDVTNFVGSNSIINTGTINVGAGATGILLQGTGTVFNSGTINAATGFAAIEFCGCGANVLTLGPGSVINGLVLGTGIDTFQLGGTGKDTFNLSLIGAGQQYDGFSTFNKTGSSNWTVTGTGAQAWNVLGGTLSVNGVINGLVTVNAGGTLGGTGTIDDVFVNGGALAPGNSIGTLNVAGSLTFTAASSYMVEISGTSSDLTRVTGVATLGGASVVVVPSGTVAKQYTILTATGNVSGTFNPVVSGVSSNLNPSLSYDTNNVYLNFALNYGGGLNVNQQNVANTLTNFFNTTGGIPVGFASLSPAGLTQVSGELATGSQQATFDAMNLFLSLMSDPFVAGRNGGFGGNSGRYRSPRRVRLAMPRRSPAWPATPLPNSRPKPISCATICSISAGASGAQPLAAAATRQAMPRSDRTMRPRARSVLRLAPTIVSRAIRWQVSRSPAAAPISASRVSAPGARICSRPAPSFAIIWARPISPPRRPMAGRSDDRAHGHGGGLRAPARPVQRQCVFRPHRGRLPLCDAMDGHDALCRRPVHHLQPAGLCGAGAGGRRHVCAELCGQGCHGRAHRTRRSHRQILCRAERHPDPARPRRLGA